MVTKRMRAKHGKVLLVLLGICLALLLRWAAIAFG
ncbi:small membrane protein YniD [Serratia rubidaea]|nr:small membrane protein YniD [Serratia rubidaea]